jgi:hypothetical protein
MRDVTITSARIRNEARAFGLCGGAALSANTLSILYYGTSWVELVTTLHVTFAVAVVFYFVYAAGRGVIGVVRNLLKQKRENGER